MSTKAEYAPEHSDIMRWRGQQSIALLNDTREEAIEGALRASKTTICLRKRLKKALKYPGIHLLIARWTDDATHGILKPVWRAMCLRAGVELTWNGEEQYDELPLVHHADCRVHRYADDACDCEAKASRVYIRGLKSQDQTNRYSKFRGLTLADVYVDQAEEMPQDVYLELAARLSQPGFPHQITISPNAVEEDHWIAKEFPAHNRDPQRKYISLSVHDNAHNLSADVIPALYRLYPPEHPKHRTMVLGKRGMNVMGTPVYAGAFLRDLHVGVAEFDPALELQLALDFGKHHPCLVARQVSSFGQRRYLGGILGQDMFLDTFLDLVAPYLARWFPEPAGTRWCCDPAGAVPTSHGTPGASKMLHERHIKAVSVPDSNSPIVRLAAIDAMSGQMKRRAADRSEAFVVSNSERWLRISVDDIVIDHFLADGFEAGYVWSPHTISVANKQVRVPKKDGWYEHGQNCAEYLEINFGMRTKKAKPDDGTPGTKERKTPEPPRGAGAWMGA